MAVKHALLALLYQKPMYGYELGKQLSLAFKVDWDVKPGQIASTLTRLYEAGWVDYQVMESGEGPDRKVYQLTESGLTELCRWYLTPDVREYQLGDAFYAKLVLSLLGSPVEAEQVLVTQRRELYQQLHQVNELRREANPPTDLPWMLLLESAMMHLEADLRWIEMCEARLSELKAYTPPPPTPKPRGRPRKDGR
ncbi:MAG TPA: PadR family transcriptional regulator [Aggregatilineaceae bacterium]|nr:PadR family transcriptional regulator [Aggregatilineaceae bacterium]